MKQKTKKMIISILAVLAIIICAGIAFYNSNTRVGNKMRRMLWDIRYMRTVKFEEDNLYKYGIDGILEAAKEKIKIPEDCYLGDSFILQFDSDGTITGFDFDIYGQSKNGKNMGFLFTYNSGTNGKIQIYKSTYIDKQYEADNQLNILKDTVNAVFKDRTSTKWNSPENTNYEMRYYNKRDWGANTEGIIYIDKQHQEKKAGDITYGNLEVNSLSVTLTGEADNSSIIPERYVLVEDINNIPYENPNSVESQSALQKQEEKTEEELTVDSIIFKGTKKGYRLSVVDAALGTQYYSLEQTMDNGNTWKELNSDPFNGTGGMGASLEFLDEQTGALFLGRNAGASGEVFLTTDGGKTTTKLELDIQEVQIGNTSVQVYDTPNNLERDGQNLILTVGQGSDGDYNGNDTIKLISEDGGKTWKQ